MEFFWYVILYYSFINVVTMVVYYTDKRKAIAGTRRIFERRLLLLAAVGGGVGAVLAMYLFHHKTKKKKFTVAVPIWILVHIGLTVFVAYQNNHLVVSRYTYEAENVDCRIVQISDLHNAYLWFDEDYIVDAVLKEQPDMIVITGDLVDSNHTNIDKAVRQVKGLAQIADTYYVTGNHEFLLSDAKQETLLARLQDAGVIVLQDDYVMVSDYGKPFALIGIEDTSLQGSALEDVTNRIDAEQGHCFKVLLAHEPQYLEDYAREDVDLVFSGHAHGGQFVLPGIGPLVAPQQGFRPEFAKGEYICGNTHMIVSAGIGNSIVPVRLFNYPEVVVVDVGI
ncbi:MAG: metallophosphoesterase [Lachnospiraceae bacterium]|nr:metallophosphoesterase [Lachnospiraceae bacterium]